MKIHLESVQGEEREQYYVQPMMKRIWSVQLDMLKVIDRICKNYHIDYYAWFGTLLGAVRHQGFIPWDDDMDLAMLREDYERFRHCIKTALPDEWDISENQPTLISLFNTKSIRLDQEFLNKFHGCPYKTGIDIFCLDRVPQNKSDRELQLNLFLSVYGLCINWDLSEEDPQWKDKSKWDYLKEIEELSGYRFEQTCSIKEQLYFLGDRIAAMYWDEEAVDMTSMIWMCDHSHYRIPKICFDKTIEVPFENTMIPILKDYDLICKLTYGSDYMTPIEEYKHDYLKKQIDHLQKYFRNMGGDLPEAFNMTFKD